MITCAIIDDEPLAIKLLESYVERTPDLSLSGSYASAVEAISMLASEPVDLLFLDIQMPEVDGLAFARMMQNSRSQIVFTTAFSEYAVDSYKVCATDYLLKPIAYEDFLGAVTKAKKIKNAEDAVSTENTSSARGQMDKSLFVKSDYKMVRLRYDEILFVEGLKDYVKIHIDGERRPVVSLSSMRTVETELPAPFMRVHRSFIVNMERVDSVERGQIIVSGHAIPVSDSYRDQLQAYVLQHTLNTRS